MPRGGGRRQRMGLLVGVVLALAGVGAACAPEPPPPPPRAVVVYGDSLTTEARVDIRARIQALLPDRQVLIHSYGGTAQCDWHQQMLDDAAAFTVDAVVIQFSGNNFTSCMTSRTQRVSPPPSSIADAYRADAQWAVDLWQGKGVPLAFVAGPARVGLLPGDDAVGSAYRGVAAARSVMVIDPAPLFVGDDGRYAPRMPCLVGECDADVIQVRSYDGVHFCVSPPTGPEGCSTYSSGTVRFAESIVHGVAALVGVPQPPYRTMVTPTTTTTTTTTTTSTSTTTSSTTTTSTTTSTTTTTAPAE